MKLSRRIRPSSALARALCSVICLALLAAGLRVEAQGLNGPPTRLILIKVDGLPQEAIDQFVHVQDPRTGRSSLPWIEKLFYTQGVRFANYYSSGISLSEPSWAVIDTGRHALVKGNFEMNRNTGEISDHLNFVFFYYEAARHRRLYPAAVDAFDSARIPLVSDAFRFEERETGIQLIRRGTKFYDFLEVGLKPFSGSGFARAGDLLVGVDFKSAFADTIREKFVAGVENPSLRYVDYYSPFIDETIHDDNSSEAILHSLKDLDRVIGEAYAALVRSQTLDRSIIAVVSDHGATYEDEGKYSQGVNLMSYLLKRQFGAHSMISRQGALASYTMRGTAFRPDFTETQVTPSPESYYSTPRKQRVTCEMDFDGNERAQIQFREPDLNLLQLLLEALRTRELDTAQVTAVASAVTEIVDRHREDWTRQIDGLREELGAIDRLRRSSESELTTLVPFVKHEQASLRKGTYVPGAALGPFAGQSKINAIDRLNDLDQRAKELTAIVYQRRLQFDGYTDYTATLRKRLELTTLEAMRTTPIEQLFGDRDLGRHSDAIDLANYPVALSEIALDASGRIDLDRSVARVNYFKLFLDLRITNSLRRELGTSPIAYAVADVDVVQAQIASREAGISTLADATDITSARLVYVDEVSQLLLVERTSPDGQRLIGLFPIAAFKGVPATRTVSFVAGKWRDGLPFGLFEDPALASNGVDRTSWLSGFHTPREWLVATHRTAEGLAVAGLCEALSTDYRKQFESAIARDASADMRLARRLDLRRRDAVTTDLFLRARPHWNFDLKDFNPGGNHGGFGRQSMHGSFWLFGGVATRIRTGPFVVELPYEGLDVAPTLLEAAGVSTNGTFPLPLQMGGFSSYPGQIGREALRNQEGAAGGP